MQGHAYLLIQLAVLPDLGQCQTESISLLSAAHVVLMTKAMLVLLIELAILPVVYGFWLDVCALYMLTCAIQNLLSAGQVALMCKVMLVLPV